MRAVSRDHAGFASAAAVRTFGTRPPRTGASGSSILVALRVAGGEEAAGTCVNGVFGTVVSA